MKHSKKHRYKWRDFSAKADSGIHWSSASTSTHAHVSTYLSIYWQVFSAFWTECPCIVFSTNESNRHHLLFFCSDSTFLSSSPSISLSSGQVGFQVGSKIITVIYKRELTVEAYRKSHLKFHQYFRPLKWSKIFARWSCCIYFILHHFDDALKIFDMSIFSSKW